MVRHQQGSALRRDVLAALDAHAIDRVNEYPHHKPNQRCRHEFDRINGRDQRHQPAEQKHGGNTEVQQFKSAVDEAGQADSDERKLIRRCDDAAFSRGIRTMLNDGHHRHREEAACESQDGDKEHRGREVRTAREEKRKDRHARSAKRYQAVLDLPAGKIAGGHASDTDAYPDCGQEVSGHVGSDVENNEPVVANRILEQRREHEEVGYSQDREEKRPVPAHRLPFIDKAAKGIDPERLCAACGANVVSLNEVEKYVGGYGNEDQPAKYASKLKAATGKTWYYKFAQRDGNTNGQGNLILTTFAIEDSDGYQLSYSRSVARVQILVGGIRVNVFSTHLDADSAARRTTQMNQLKSWASSFSEQRILAGDFNAWPGAAEISTITSAYIDTWAAAKTAGTSVAYSGNEAGNTRNSRIDYVFLSKGASRTTIKASQVFDVRNSSGVAPSDHRPVMTTFLVK